MFYGRKAIFTTQNIVLYMESIYQQMWADAFPKIKSGKLSLDTQIDNPSDNRIGITLLLRPSSLVVKKMQNFLAQAHKFAPNQYYYPANDLHLTVLSIFSCSPNFSLAQINLADYQAVISQALEPFKSFQIEFSGITLSSSGVVAKGYDKTGTLNEIRSALRTAFKATDLAHTIDKRYVLKAAHSTLLRFKTPLKNKTLFADFLTQHQSIPLGVSEVQAIDLVSNDWYMKTNKVRVLEKYTLD